MGFHVFIDESGEQGIQKVREGDSKGASPYFVMGAVVCRTEELEIVRGAITKFKRGIPKKAWKHASDLRHREKKFLAQKLGLIPARYFAIISKKNTLEDYKDDIDSDSAKFYNKCVQYLLEIVCKYLVGAGASFGDIEIVFEHCNHDYGQMKRFIETIKKNPMRPQSKVLQVISTGKISTLTKGTDEALEIADFAAHAVYSCVNLTPKNYFIPETAYLEILGSRFGGDAQGKVLNTGIRCIHRIADVGLTKEVEKLLIDLRSQPPVNPAGGLKA